MLFPTHVKLTEAERSNICYLSFPDSNSGCMGDTQFHFRIRHTPSKLDMMENPQFSKMYNSKCPPALQVDHNYILGYVYFRQVKDPSLRRGYFQKVSLCIQIISISAKFYTRVDRFYNTFTLCIPVCGDSVQISIFESLYSNAWHTCPGIFRQRSWGYHCRLPRYIHVANAYSGASSQPSISWICITGKRSFF